MFSLYLPLPFDENKDYLFTEIILLFFKGIFWCSLEVTIKNVTIITWHNKAHLMCSNWDSKFLSL